MTQEQAIKHGEVIKWWLDNTNKGVWVRLENPKEWRISKHPSWDITLPYVQNDEYAELRKAQVDGKVIEYNAHWNPEVSGVWKKDTLLDFHLPARNYRIKPAGPKFKVGNWVRTPDGLYKIYDTDYLDTEPYLILEHSTETVLAIDCKLWQPQEGDIVIGIRKSMTPYLMTYKDYKCQVDNFVSFDNVIPYIGQDFKEMI